ncbi:MAG TPA: ZIP family metal transporter [Epulopiscium sp.]|nr:ZIP family metal transporter [Candidatus Epulonipiscium sp.]
MNIWTAGGIGVMAEGVGVTTGIMLFVLLKMRSKKWQGMMMGFAAGLMTAIICFDILPNAFEQGGVLVALVGVILGLSIGLSLDNITSVFTNKIYAKKSNSVKTGIILTLAIALHNIPEGIALGTLFAISPQTGIKVALIVMLHSIPEGIAIAIPLKKGGVQGKTLGVICATLASLMGIGAMVGFVASSLSPIIVTLAMGFAAGVILYIVCEELIPESKEVWNGRLTTVAVVLGIVLGILITVGL